MKVSAGKPDKYISTSIRQLFPKEFSADHILSHLLDSLPDMIHSVNKEGEIVFVNKQCTKILGYSQEEMLALTIYDLYAPEIQSKVRRGFQDLMKKGDMRVRESLLKTKTGDLIPVEIRSFGLYDEDGKFNRTFSMLRDIREIKEVRENLMHAERLTGIGQLASCVIHDIHNPLMVMQLYTEILLQDAENYFQPSSREEASDHLMQMQKASEKIHRLLTQLRNFSRRQAEMKEDVELNSLIDDTLFMVMNKIVSHNINVQRHNNEKDFIFSGYLVQWEQAMMNIISNACDAMKDSETRTLDIMIVKCTIDDHEYYRCSFKDTGCGIPEEKMENIFTPFFTTKKHGEGTGLGLAICKEIVERHEGSIDIKSTVGEGTTFQILIPV